MPASTQPARRTLSPSEAVYIRLRTFIVYSVCVDGDIDLSAMRRAFVALREAHPLLGCTLKQNGEEAYFESDDIGQPTVLVSEREPDPLALPGLELDQARALSGLEIVRRGHRARVDLHVHHSMADAAHGLTLLEELWARYTDCVTNGDTALDVVEVQPLPASYEELLAARGVRKGERTGLEWLAPPSPATPSPAAPKPEPIRHELSMTRGRMRLTNETTAALEQAARANGTTLDALASAAILAAAASFHPAAATRSDASPTPLPFILAMNVRPHLTPPAKPADGTTMMGLSTHLALFGPRTSLLDVARGIDQRRNAELSEGLIQQAVLHESFTKTPEKVTPPTEVVAVFSTNWGMIPDVRVPDGLVATDFVGMLFPPARTHAGVPMFLLTTFQGQLSMQAMFTAARPGLPTTQQILDAVKSQIDGLLRNNEVAR
ncbi:hypothetical protein LZC95_19305 [Pendulispora brunnea]|uniref:Phthiocerol/phthiodiolone dimycocerosyl transferase n=1 Tax=Pendulispora brunnea TaxID=2905690 RepID=A0ABZ2KJV4_9BACT